MKTSKINKDIFVAYNKPEDVVLDNEGTIGCEIDFTKTFGGNTLDKLNEFKNNPNATTVLAPSVDGEPVPPIRFFRGAQHHWLEKKDCDGHSWGLIVLQWNPGAKRWSHSGYVGSGIYVNTKHWVYHSHCPIPD